jgi:hypothetical protein
MTRLLVITGPQGSGNHLFSKLFSAHPDVYGWKELLKQHWITHDHEPFNSYWHQPDLLKDFNWSQADYYVTSISCPYINDSKEFIPKYFEFFAELKKQKIQTSLLIVGRDENILEFQQQRIRDKHTLVEFKKQLHLLVREDPIYVSQELAYLYKGDYLLSLGQQLHFPVTADNEILSNILSVNANKKYFREAEMSELDLTIRRLNGR